MWTDCICDYPTPGFCWSPAFIQPDRLALRLHDLAQAGGEPQLAQPPQIDQRIQRMQRAWIVAVIEGGAVTP
jgi:hypothetical protein